MEIYSQEKYRDQFKYYNKKIRSSIIGKLWLFLRANLWYIPIFAVLLCIKISLISRLMMTVTNKGGEDRTDADRIITNQILKIVQENIKQNVKESQALRRRFNSTLANPIKTQVNSKTKNNSYNRGVGVGSGTGWDSELRKVHQPLSSEDWELLANIEEAHIQPTAANRTGRDSIWLVMNHVPKGGGEYLSGLLEDLEEENEFKHLQHEYRTPWPRFLLEEEQGSLVNWFEYQHLPRSYDRHFYFVNFTKFQKYVFEKPIYINIVQDPVSRLQSEFLWKREDKERAALEVERREALKAGSGKEWLEKDFSHCVLSSDPECAYETGSQDFTMSIPFFCGQFNSCVIINNKWALQSAKFNIEKYYSVVGIMENLEETLTVLENYVPRFFAGATAYSPENLAKNAPLSPSVRQILEHKLPMEFELYKFIRERMEKQLQFINERNSLQTKNKDLK